MHESKMKHQYFASLELLLLWLTYVGTIWIYVVTYLDSCTAYLLYIQSRFGLLMAQSKS